MSSAVAVASYAVLENPKQVHAAHAARYKLQDQALTAGGTYLTYNSHYIFLVMQACPVSRRDWHHEDRSNIGPRIKHLQLPSKHVFLHAATPLLKMLQSN